MRENVHDVALTTSEHSALCGSECDGTPWQNVASLHLGQQRDVRFIVHDRSGNRSGRTLAHLQFEDV